MNLFVRPRNLRATRLPALRVLETSRLLLHEEADPARVEGLVLAFRRDRVLRNPPAVAPLSHGGRPDEAAVVLDGANRVSALRVIGARHVIAQVVHYADPAIILSTWRHYVVGEGAAGLRGRIAARPGIRLTPVRTAREAEARLEQHAALAAIVDGRGAALVGPGGGPPPDAALLRDFVAAYQPGCEIYRVDGGDAEAWRAEHGPGTLVIFPPLTKEAILAIAARGGGFPAGITRHVIPGRVLRLNAPLAWLESGETTATKQRTLEAAVEHRWRQHGVRYYAEPTYLFDE
ncbi:MAG TPA: hypothetical protein VKV57_10915 [bacterium]|nr:hypothetical protein [bacterium]